MNTKNLKRKIRVAGVAFFLLFGIGIFSATTANAQWDRDRDDNRNSRRDRDDNDRYDRNDRNDRNNRYVTQQAYRQGLSEGSMDARNGRRANAQRAAGQAMRRMSNGGGSNYRQQFREAFIRGYQEGYDRNDNDRNNRRNRDNRRNNGY